MSDCNRCSSSTRFFFLELLNSRARFCLSTAISPLARKVSAAIFAALALVAGSSFTHTAPASAALALSSVPPDPSEKSPAMIVAPLSGTHTLAPRVSGVTSPTDAAIQFDVETWHAPNTAVAVPRHGSSWSRATRIVDFAPRIRLTDPDGNTPIRRAGISVTNHRVSIAQPESSATTPTSEEYSVHDTGEDTFRRGSFSAAHRSAQEDPAIDENFLTMGGVLDHRITFSRASSATLVGSNGLIQTAGINRPRFDYDPTTVTLNGLLLEQGSTNQQLDSSFNIFAGGIYRWYGSHALLTFNSALAPDGTTAATTITDNLANDTHQAHYVNGVFPVGLNPNIPFYKWPVGGPQTETCSMFFKAGTLRFARLELYENAIGAGVAVDIDLHAGILKNGGTIGSGSTYLASSIKAYSNGIYRVSVSGIIPDPHNLSCSPLTEESLGEADYVGSGGTISVWGADLENNAIPTSYLYTASVPNLQLDSDNFANWGSGGDNTTECGNGIPCNSDLTVNAAAAPDGTFTAAQLADDSTYGNHLTNHAFGLGGPAVMATIGQHYATVTCSQFFKEATQRYAQLQCGTGGSSFVNGEANSGISVDIDLQNGTIANGGTYGVRGSDQTTYLGSSIETLPNTQFPSAPTGWYRVSVTGIIIIEADVHIQPLLASSLGNISYAGTGSTIFIWGPQVEQHRTPTLSDDIPVGEIPVGATTRAPDIATQPLVRRSIPMPASRRGSWVRGSHEFYNRSLLGRQRHNRVRHLGHAGRSRIGRRHRRQPRYAGAHLDRPSPVRDSLR